MSLRLQPEWGDALERRYEAQAADIQHAEALETTEYGRQPSEEEIRTLFPFFPSGDSLLALSCSLISLNRA